MNHILSLEGDDFVRLEELFEKISIGNTVLILGAGSSVTPDKKYLSQQVIEYYEAKKNISFGTSDIIEFVDIIEKSNKFNRKEFDQYVYDLLYNIKISETHKTIAAIPWRQIITTNYDLLIEKAFDEIKGTADQLKEIIPIRSIQEFNNLTDVDEIKYIKLHGCMSDKGKYPFVFSSADYLRIKKFYRAVLQHLKSPSDNIQMLSVGYSFSDSFAYSFLKDLDKDSYRGRRWLYNVDPFVNDNMLDYFKENKIAVIKLTSEDFFKQYKIWEESKYDRKRHIFRGTTIKNKKNETVLLSNKLQYNLDFSLKQLNDSCKNFSITEKDFLLGEEPSFDVVLKDYDIIKEDLTNSIKEFVLERINDEKSTLIPIFCLSGSFGTGKTTYTYRFIKSIIDDPDVDIIAFEITNFDNIKIKDYIELILKSNTQNILFYTNNIEVDSVFKSLLSFRAELSMRQIPSSNIFFIASIRDNILNRHKSSTTYSRLFEYPLPSILRDDEIDVFVSKLKKNDLIQYRDIHEKNSVINEIKKDYQGDPFISLVQLVSHGRHINNLREAYFELSNDCRKAFLYTALIHRFSLLMPASILNELISKDWDEFKTNIIEVEGKGILIQEIFKSKDLDSDLYFRTKHPIIADLLVKEILKTKDKIFDNYLFIIRRFIQTQKMAKLLINLLKAIAIKDELSHEKINKLYDAAFEKFQDEPHFVLNYTINLQKRNNKTALLKALELLVYAEALMEKRNDRFIHRRGVISFDLAKLYYKEEVDLNLTLKYLNEAEEILELKQILDPFSSFSYVDYLKTLIWKLDSIQLEKEEVLSLKIQIEALYETAISSTNEGINRIEEAYALYRDKYRSKIDPAEYIKELDEMYEDSATRPYACILLYKFYENKNIELEERISLLEEMENYTYNNDVSKFLFKYYSRRLNYMNYRIKFFNLVKTVNTLKDFKTLLYNYYMYIAESYNTNFKYAYDFLKDIDKSYNYLNPDFQQVWKESDSDDYRIFSGTIVKKNGYYMFKSYNLQNRFMLKRCDKKYLQEGLKVKAYLHFYFTSIRAEIISLITAEDN